LRYLIILAESASHIAAAYKNCTGAAKTHKRRFFAAVDYSSAYAQTGGFSAEAFFSCNAVNAAVPGT